MGKFGGSLAKTPATELGAVVIRETIARAGLASDQIGEVIMGQVLAAGVGQNPARQAMMKAGVAGNPLTINAVCGSGLKAVMLAAQAVAWGDSEIDQWRVGGKTPTSRPVAQRLARRPAHGRLEDGGHHDRGRPVGRLQPSTTWASRENVAKQYGITRDMQDALALASQQKAAASQDGQVRGRNRGCEHSPEKGDPVVFNVDGTSTARPVPKPWLACARV